MAQENKKGSVQVERDGETFSPDLFYLSLKNN
jgi:hypothetical protein